MVAKATGVERRPYRAPPRAPSTAPRTLPPTLPTAAPPTAPTVATAVSPAPETSRAVPFRTFIAFTRFRGIAIARCAGDRFTPPATLFPGERKMNPRGDAGRSDDVPVGARSASRRCFFVAVPYRRSERYPSRPPNAPHKKRYMPCVTHPVWLSIQLPVVVETRPRHARCGHRRAPLPDPCTRRSGAHLFGQSTRKTTSSRATTTPRPITRVVLPAAQLSAKSGVSGSHFALSIPQ